MSSLLEQDIIRLATLAVEHDHNGDYKTAFNLYNETIKLLKEASNIGLAIPGLQNKITEYDKRCAELNKISSQSDDQQTELSNKIARAKLLMLEAIEKEEEDEKDEAFKLYMDSAELCLSLQSQVSHDDDLVKKLRQLALQSTERAEVIKFSKTKQQSTTSAVAATTTSASTKPGLKPLGFSLRDISPSRSGGSSSGSSGGGGSGSGGGGSGGGGYTKEELAVLRKTSCINGRDYVPFMDEDYREKFNYPVPFTDKDGYLKLSPKQRSNFGRWVRASELSPDPKMVVSISCFNIRQTIVSDCSFVASLAISAQYERRFNRRLITGIIYPQNRNGDPVFNQSGKYMVKLHLNGVIRKIIIDDYLPLGGDGRLLCSFSNNSNEMWVSLMEKAYMKVMGGYDFPGSNSNIDLHALTGWIPERISMTSKSSLPFNPDREFQKIHDRFHRGHCLVTMATGELGEAEAERAGLVPSHAYAMLDIQECQGKKLFQLKNPWSHLRWRGNFSELDATNWTAELKRKLNYDPVQASANDDGIFWIDYESLRRFFDVIYINWNPAVFPHTTCVHETWHSKDGPKKDSYTMGDNPQYKLDVRAGDAGGGVWVLLTRHITDKDDFADNKEFITLLVYKNEGRKVYYPSDPPPYIDGVRINSPHYLCRMTVDRGVHQFTLVVSQYEKNNTINYTIRTYATTHVLLKKIVEPYVEKYEKQVTGEWKGRSAGGCRNHATFINNPVFQLNIDNKFIDNNVLIELKAPRDYNIGFEVTAITTHIPPSTNPNGTFQRKVTGDYRRGYCYMELTNITGGVYNIQSSTYEPGQEGHFFLSVSSSCQISLNRIS